MKSVKGLFLDTTLNDTPPGSLVFAKNVLLTETLGVIQNEKGFTLHGQLPLPFNGRLAIQDKVLYWMTNNTFSEIGYLDNNGTYTKVINDDDIAPDKLNLQREYPVEGEFHINAKNETIVAWIDALNTPKILNIDDPSFQANDLELFPSADLSIPAVSVNQSGGSVKTGAYRLGYYYEDSDGALSNFSALSKPVHIISAANTSTINLIWGDEPNEVTNKSITITVSSPDPNWTYINFFAVKTINQITSIVRFKKIIAAPDVNNNIITSYTGAEVEETLSLNELFVPKAFYKNAKAITQLNNKLYLANLTTAENYTLQKFACNIKITWRSELINYNSAYKEASGTDYSTFAHGEVYAFYLQIKDIQTGLWSKGFHIPGRDLVSGDNVVISPGPANTFVSGTGSPSFKRFQLDDTCSYAGLLSGGHPTGTMGAWENQSETYPDLEEYNGTTDYNNNPIDQGRDLRGTKVKHHKFPTIGFMTNNVYSANADYGKTVLDVLKINVENVNIPADLLPKVSAWRIVYAKRDLNNATVLGTSGIYFYGKGRSTGQLKPTPTNAPVKRGSILTDTNTNNIEILSASDEFSEGSEFIRFHAFNLMVDKPNVSPNYIRQEILFSTTNTADPVNTGDPRLILNTTITTNPERKWYLYDPLITAVTRTPVSLSSADRFRNVSFIQYLPNGGIISSSGKTINNTGGEDCLLLRNNITGITNNAVKFLNLVNDSATSDTWRDSGTHKTYLSSLCVIKSDVYNTFTGQELIATDVVKDFTTEVPGEPTIVLGSSVILNGNFTTLGLANWTQVAQPGSLEVYQWQQPESGYTLYVPPVNFPLTPSYILANAAAIVAGTTYEIKVTVQPVSIDAPNFTFSINWLGAGNTFVGTELFSTTSADVAVPKVITVNRTAPPGAIKIGFSARYVNLEPLPGEFADVGIKFSAVTVKPFEVSTEATVTAGVGGGDNWIGFNSIQLQGPNSDDPTTIVNNAGGEIQGEGCKAVHYILTVSPKNPNYRHQDIGNNQSLFYDLSNLLPKIENSDWATRFLGLMSLLESPVYMYNQDYNTLNSLGFNLLAYDPLVVTETGFPTTIAASITQSEESTAVNWKTFLVSDRYTMPKNKGEITNIQGVGNQRLFIHHRDSLYITKDRTTLRSSASDVTLGSGDIFEVTPFEVLSADQGYAGTQHKFACVVTKLGYVFPDVSQGKWFIHSGEALNEISKNGLRQLWRNELTTLNIPDNPFMGTGITVAYDEAYNRLLVSFTADSGIPGQVGKQLTLSYSPQLEAWASFHDYFPHAMVAARGNKLYSGIVESGTGITKIYKHNSGPYGYYYQDPNSSLPPFALKADIVYNEQPYETKYYTSIEWVTQVVDEIGNGIIEDKTVNYITVRSNNKTSGRQQVIPYTDTLDIYDANTRYTERAWSFNNLRNFAVKSPGISLVKPVYDDFDLVQDVDSTNKEWYETGRFVANFAVVRFEYLNSATDYKFMLLDHDVKYRQSFRS